MAEETDKLKKVIKEQNDVIARLMGTLKDVSKSYVQKKDVFKNKSTQFYLSPFLYSVSSKLRKWFPKLFKIYDYWNLDQKSKKKALLILRNNEVSKDHPGLNPFVTYWHNFNHMDLEEYLSKGHSTWSGVEVAALDDLYEEGLLDIKSRVNIEESLKKDIAK
jgi:hypothetical protein